MKIRLNLAIRGMGDVHRLLEMAVSSCGYSLPRQVIESYKTWVTAVEASYDGGQFVCFGPNDCDEVNELIQFQRDEISGVVPDMSAKISMSAAILKVFRDYMMYALIMMPVGTSVYWKPSVKRQLTLVVSDEGHPKGYVKLI